MPSPCEGVQLLRSTRRLKRWSTTADMSRSSVSSTTCGSLARPAPTCTTEWLQGVVLLPPQCRGEVEAFQFDRGGSDAARRGGADVERATRPPTRMFVICQDVLSHCAVFRGCNGPDQEFFLVDQEHHVKRPDLIACGSLQCEFFSRKGRKSD